MNMPKLMSAVALLACAAIARADDPRLEAKGEEDRKTIAMLETLKVSLNFTDAPLTEVVDFFREVTSVNILISKSVKEGGEDHPVTLKVDELKATDCLALVTKMVDLSYTIEEGVVMIVTQEETKKNTYLELYDVRDLLMHLRDFKAPEISLSTAGEGEGVGISTSGSEDSGSTLDDSSVLTDLIKNHTAGTSWTDNPKCSCEIQNGMLIIVQTKEGHQQVSALVEKLRQYK
jgi:type II secretory pathway component GspD/PulD (secretin)